MTRDGHASQWTPHQIGALVTLLIVALWSTAVVWIYTVTPASGDTREMAFVGTVAIMSWLLLPLYWRRVRWSYVGGILVTVLLLIGAAMVIPHRVIYFSLSVYNLSVPLAYAAALACAYFRACLQTRLSWCIMSAYEQRRPNRQAMGAACALAPTKKTDWASAKGPSADHQRHPVGLAHGGTVARHAGALRPVEDGV